MKKAKKKPPTLALRRFAVCALCSRRLRLDPSSGRFPKHDDRPGTWRVKRCDGSRMFPD